MERDARKEYLTEALNEFRKMKAHADRALTQVSDEDFFRTIDEESNSLAIIIKHMVGNMRSRWTDLLTSDGEKEWRNRDTEFALDDQDSRVSLMERWESSWRLVFDAIKALTPDQLFTTITIRQEPYNVLRAINRQLVHYSHHIGQIVFLAKHLKSKDWQTLSIPLGKSQNFNAQMQQKHSAE